MEINIYDQLIKELYVNDNPYNYSKDKPDHRYPHTNIVDSLIEEILVKTKPNFWLEVGTMLGGSIIKTANKAKHLGLSTKMICIDPFTGDVNMWDWEKKLKENNQWRFLHLKNGKPSIYDRFLANIIESGHQDSILPITCTSIVGMRLLKRLYEQNRLSQLPEVIYLDSAHEKDETFLELTVAWDLLANKGVLWGDDWSWQAVSHDVSRFCEEKKINLQIKNGQWILFK